MQLSPSTCPLCGSAQASVAGRLDRHRRPLTTLLCLSCGLYRSDPLPSPEQLRAFYEKQYRLEYKGVAKPKAHHVLRAARAARDRLNWLQPHLPDAGRWLDAGAGSGEFAFLLQRRGMDVLALEPNQGYAAYIRDDLGIPVRQGFIEDLPTSSGPFAGISCFHVLEHHPDPVEALSRFRTLLAPAGLLAVEVPNSGFAHIHPRNRFHPAHLVHFNPANLELAAHAAGFVTIECRASRDGGIVWGVFRPGPAHTVHPLPGAAGLLAAQERGRSAARYYVSPRVWGRTMVRVARLGFERCRTIAFTSSRDYLSQLPLR
ncbi:MAG: class I SAM-dependent methyltransferase [Bryobacteraceae bacterium]|nr:class I SAM-dependent methyltransferase [Solibacteraceae bacterium]MCO5353251.1 class I SAM-dependent methyltransferase [Bryobacteraceae bacterium]